MPRRGSAAISYPVAVVCSGRREVVIELGTLLAGPIVRRAEPSRVCLWVATSEESEVQATAYRLDSKTGSVDEAVGWGTADTRQIGERLFVHLVTVTAEGSDLPTDELLGYDLEFEGPTLADLGLLDGPSRICYGALPLPTFFIRGRTNALNILHGSCRLLHGKGEDAMVAADEIMSRRALDISTRPVALFLTGDQIYADDVAGPVIVHLRRLADELVGKADGSSVPGIPSLGDVEVYGRRSLAHDLARFTSDRASNHLFSFGEFATMYLFAWNEQNWPESFAVWDDVIPPELGAAVSVRSRRKYESEIEDLERARAALPAVRRLLANIACYMCFDDHETTDDWNITSLWRARVHQSATGRRVVVNALASFWAFQGWGNDPEAFPERVKSAVTRLVAGDGDVAGFEGELLSFDGWSFVAPTDPPALVLDTRTQRSFDAPEGAAHLVGAHGRARLTRLLRSLHRPSDAALICVSPVPVCGLELQERRQKFMVKKVGPYQIDFEAWQSNLKGFVEMMECLMLEVGVKRCVFLSGDVHYGLNLRFFFSIGEEELDITQLVSSGFKHSGAVSRSALYLLGHLVHERHERIGWRRPPPLPTSSKAKQRFMLRAVNTDEWSDDAPVFLSPRRAAQLGIEEEPEFRELRVYVRPHGRSSSVLIGENNVGMVSLRDDELEHRLLGRDGGGTSEHIATLRLDEDRAAYGASE